MELPVSFADYTRTLLGDEDYKELVTSLESEQSVSIRLNPLKPFAFRSGEHAVPWCTSGFYLEERPTFTFDPLFHAGCYYVQEASSMFVEQALKQYMGEEPVVMLDLCAAPGGKSTHIRSLLPDNSLLIANEVIRNRSQILAENLTKWGHPDVVVTNSDPSDFTPLEDFFDVILTDVPCSGEGMFRKDPVAISEWSPENVEICRQRQRRIIADIWPCLNPGGILIDSTCTYNTQENESFPVYRFLPHKTQGEGFFLAVLRKSGMSVRNSGDKQLISLAIAPETPGLRAEKSREKGRKVQGKGKQTPGLSKEQLAILQKWIFTADKYEFIQKGGNVSAFPKCYIPELSALQSSLRIVQAGLEIAGQKGKDWIPCHALAVSGILVSDAFPCEEISYEQAIVYLRKEAVTLSDAAPRGVVLLTYKHVPLGFVKNIGNRANNLYPQEWRIRSGYLPETVVKVHS